jgi:hypothetical protein
MSGLPKVTIDKKNGALGGVVPANDGEALLVAGFINPLTAIPSQYAAFKVASYDEFLTYLSGYVGYPGGDVSDDTETLTMLAYQVQRYFEASNNVPLHIVLVQRASNYDTLLTVANTGYVSIKNYLVSQNGAIKLVGFVQNPNYVETFANGIASDLIQGIVKAQAFADAEFAEGRPIDIMLEGRGIALNSSTLTDLRLQNAPNVSVVAWQNKTKAADFWTFVSASASANYKTDVRKYAEVGYTLGWLAKLPIMRNIGRVLNGAINLTQGIADSSGSYTETSQLGKATIDSATDKGYIFPCLHPTLTGYYFNDEPTCTSATNDFKYISRSRTINKAARITRRVYTERLKDEVYVDPDTGKLSALSIKSFEGTVEQAINLEMVRLGECTSVIAFVDPEQDVLTTSEIIVDVRIIPVGQSRFIGVKVGFAKVI